MNELAMVMPIAGHRLDLLEAIDPERVDSLSNQVRYLIDKASEETFCVLAADWVEDAERAKRPPGAAS